MLDYNIDFGFQCQDGIVQAVLVIPRKYRKFTSGEGHQFLAYFQDSAVTRGLCIVCTRQILDNYIGWDEFKKRCERIHECTWDELLEGEEWTENDHEAFKEFLEWLNENDITGYIQYG